jgi:hypothetical protein
MITGQCSRPPQPVRRALARSPNDPCYREARWDRSNRISSSSRLRGGLDAMIQPVVEVPYVNQAMGEPLYRQTALACRWRFS